MKNKKIAISFRAIFTFILCFIFAMIFWISISYGDIDSLNILGLTYGL